MIIAYQTYRNEPVGIAQVRQSCEHDSYLYLTAIETKEKNVLPSRLSAMPSSE